MESTNYTNLNQVEQDTQSCEIGVKPNKTYEDYFKQTVFTDISMNSRLVIDTWVRSYVSTRDLTNVTSILSELAQSHPKVKPYIDEQLVIIYSIEGDYETAWKYYNGISKCYNSLRELLFFQGKIDWDIIDGETIMNTLSKPDIKLTLFGKQHIQDIIPFITQRYRDYINEHGGDFFKLFNCAKVENISLRPPSHNYELIKHLPNDMSFNMCYTDDYKNNEKTVVLYSNLFIKIVRESEDDYRLANNLPKIGEGWVNETLLYSLIKKAFPTYKVIHQGSPKWLGRQKFDIYIPSANLAIEYQGVYNNRKMGHQNN